MRVIVLLLLIFYMSFTQAIVLDGFTKFSVQEAHQRVSRGEVILVDIRSEKEWLDSGVSPHAKTVSMHQKGGIAAFEDELIRLLNGDKSQPIALICAAGVRSDRMQQYLKQKGFSSVADVKGGMLGNWMVKGWIDKGLPVVDYMSVKK